MVVFVLLRSVEERCSSITLMYGLGRLCRSLSHRKELTFQLRLFRNGLSKSHCCVISLLGAIKLTFKIDLQEFLTQNEINSGRENKKGLSERCSYNGEQVSTHSLFASVLLLSVGVFPL